MGEVHRANSPKGCVRGSGKLKKNFSARRTPGWTSISGISEFFCSNGPYPQFIEKSKESMQVEPDVILGAF